MSERWGDRKYDRDYLDAYLTADRPDPIDTEWEELDPTCTLCGQLYSDHPTVQAFDEEGNDYETQTCPKPKCRICHKVLADGRAHHHTLAEVVALLTGKNQDLPDTLSGDGNND